MPQRRHVDVGRCPGSGTLVGFDAWKLILSRCAMSLIRTTRADARQGGSSILLRGPSRGCFRCTGPKCWAFGAEQDLGFRRWGWPHFGLQIVSVPVVAGCLQCRLIEAATDPHFPMSSVRYHSRTGQAPISPHVPESPHGEPGLR